MDDFVERLRSALSYDPETGVFIWRKFRGCRAIVGSEAGTIDSKGHRQIRFEMRLIGAHRLAWIISHGRLPDGEIDHINRIRSDNRLCNLRECSHSENCRNRGIYSSNTSGVAGVSWYPKLGKWVAYIRAGAKRKHLGYFAEKDDAIAARAAAERDLFGSFAPEARAA